MSKGETIIQLAKLVGGTIVVLQLWKIISLMN
jgi:hypothetical protein